MFQQQTFELVFFVQKEYSEDKVVARTLPNISDEYFLVKTVHCFRKKAVLFVLNITLGFFYLAPIRDVYILSSCIEQIRYMTIYLVLLIFTLPVNFGMPWVPSIKHVGDIGG